MSDLASRRFLGIARLVGEPAFSAYTRAHIGIVGIGGVGSWVAEALARSGVGALTLIDLDMVAESNVNRQIHALPDVFGAAKVSVMGKRIGQINPECKLTLIEDFVTPENVPQLLAGPLDVIVDAIDQVHPKVAMAAFCKTRKIPLVMTGAAGGKTDPARIRVDDLARTTQDPLLSKVRGRLRREHGFTREPQRKFGITAIYSDEPVRLVDNCPTASGNLSCSGYGSSVCVTAGFGFVAAQRALATLVKS